MRTRATRFAAVAAATAAITMGVVGDSMADDKVELGAFGGVHIFNEDNELGQVEIDGADSPKNSFAFGIRVSYAWLSLLSAEVELALMPTSARESETDLVVLGWRGHLLLHLTNPRARVRPFILAGGGALTASSSDSDIFDNDTDALFHAGVGLKLRVGESWGFRLDGRILFPPSSESESATTDFEGTLGIYKTFGHRSPPPVVVTDADSDGIPDASDKCPNDAEDIDQFEDADGCPEPDNDGDGIPDTTDKCPNEAETKNGVDDEDGCPEADEDADGIFGSADKCPTEPEDVDKFQDEDGCPDPDNDADGVPDQSDQCPDEAETKNNYEDEDGCPDTIPTAVQQFTGTIEGIKFKTKSATILKSSYKVLDAAVKVLSDYPNVRLEIQGHTDDVGTDEFNQDLSQRRAESVRTYIVGKGIDAGRLEAKGYGETTPVADNATKEGKTKNRRVDFVLVQGGGSAPPPPPAPTP